MGVYTSFECKDGTEVQVKTGNDSCQYFKLGDTVDFYVNPNHVESEHLLDGIYEGYYSDDFEACVVIKNHIFQEIVPLIYDSNKNWEISQSLYKKYEPFPEYKSYFTNEAWAEYEYIMDCISRESWRTPKQANLRDAMLNPISASLNYRGVANKMLVTD